MKSHIFRYKTRLFLLLLVCPLLLSSCSDDDDIPDVPQTARQTVLMYMPWSGSSIYSYFLHNIESFETAIENNNGLEGNALLVFISEDRTTSHLIKITYDKGECVRDTLKSYNFSECNYTTASGIASIITDAMDAAPAYSYAMAIGCHGMGVDTGRYKRNDTFKNHIPERGRHPAYTLFRGHIEQQLPNRRDNSCRRHNTCRQKDGIYIV